MELLLCDSNLGMMSTLINRLPETSFMTLRHYLEDVNFSVKLSSFFVNALSCVIFPSICGVCVHLVV